MSSANRREVANWTESGMSLIKMINRRGPSMLPWDTPEVTGSSEERVPSIQTICDLLDRYELNQFQRSPVIPILLSL